MAALKSNVSSVSRRVARGALARRLQRLWDSVRPVSAFEKAIAANSAIIVIETGVGYWITQHNPETYHYLIDTAFIALAALLGVIVNFFVLRASFAPLNRTLEVVQAVARGDLAARAPASPADPDAQALATAFNSMLDELEQARDEVARQVLQAHEAERRRVALELHDQIGQSLTALTLHAQALSRRLDASPTDPRAAGQAERLATLAQRTLGEVQSLSYHLRPTLLDDAGLSAALRALASDAHERLSVETHLDLRDLRDLCDGVASSDERLPGELETALFRIAQESLTNAARHGHARHAWIRLRRSPQAISLLIVDDGQGFDPGAAPRRHGLGVPGMRERAHLVGGALRIRSRPGAGCVVWAHAPLPTASEPREAVSAVGDGVAQTGWRGVRS
jgi:two-component system sensor histidine kinase UhpB